MPLDEASLQVAERIANHIHDSFDRGRIRDLVAEVRRLQLLLGTKHTEIDAIWIEENKRVEAQRDAWRQMAHDLGAALKGSVYSYSPSAPGVAKTLTLLAEFDRLVAEQEGTGASGPGRADRSAD